MAEAQKYNYAERYRRVHRVLAIFFTISVIGSMVIYYVIPSEISCQLRDTHWFTALWPPNYLNLEQLAKLQRPGEACRLIPAAAWTSGIGLLMVSERFVFELMYNERRNIIGVRASLLFLFVFIIGIEPTLYNPTIIGTSRSVLSISTSHYTFITYTQNILIPFITMYCLSEAIAFIMILIRSATDSMKSKM